MKRTIFIICLLVFMGNLAMAQYRLTPSTIDTTILQPKNFFQKDSSNMQGDYTLTAGYHLQNAGVDLMASVIIGVVGGLLTGVLSYASSDRSQSGQASQSMTYASFGGAQSDKTVTAAMVSGGVTLVATLSLVVAAGSHLNKAGKIMNGIYPDE